MAERKSQTGAGKSGASSKSTGGRAKGPDLLDMLSDDHKRVKKLFSRFEKLESEDEEAQQIARQVCLELELHARLEEELFYPALRGAIADEDLVDEAEVEHQSAKDLIAKIRELSPEDPKFRATVCVLGEYVNHHVKEEESDIFDQARSAKLDLQALAQRALERREALMAELGMVGAGGGATQASSDELEAGEPAQGSSGAAR